MSEDESLVKLYVFETYKGLITEGLSNIIEKSYIKEGYCFSIIDMLIDTMVKINNVTIEEAEKHFLGITEKYKKE